MDDYKAWLPPVDENYTLALPHFPTRFQAVIFRLWESTPADKIAQVLRCSADEVRALAEGMGLGPQTGDFAAWRERGYITTIRAMWHLLPYEQLMELLDLDRGGLSFILREDDFLSHKLGNAKAAAEPVYVRPLTAAEQAATARLRAAVTRWIRPLEQGETVPAFDFFHKTADPLRKKGPCPDGAFPITADWGIDDRTGDPDCALYAADFREDLEKSWNVALQAAAGERSVVLRLDPALSDKPEEYHELDIRPEGVTVTAGAPMGILRGLYALQNRMDALSGPYLRPGMHHCTPAFGARYIYSYCGLYGAPLDADLDVSFPDTLLRTYARTGVNGVWLQAVLYKLVPFPFDPSLSEGWEGRMERLRALIARAKRRGLRVYLYINEPRAMPLQFFDAHPDIKGFVRGENASLCTSHPAVQQYLRDGIRTLCENAPGLGGFFTISVSENQTNCYSHSTQDQQTCPRCRLRRREEVVAEVNSLIADTAHAVDPRIRTIVWTWGWRGFGEAERLRAIRLLSENCIVQNTAEEMMDIEKAGIKLVVRDYTLSNIPPSASSIEGWREAKRSGHKTSAKVQLNTTWEGSTAPFIPVYENICRYMENLRAQGVENLQLSWTLGGWPSENLRIASAYFFDEEEPFTYEDTLRAACGEWAGAVKKAVSRFCAAFAEFPFHIGVLYQGPQNAGPANLLFGTPTGLGSTMTCYAYDDLDHWRAIYPEDVYVAQLEKLSRGWREGMKELEGMPVCEFSDTAAVCGALFEASYNQARFVQERRRLLADPENAEAKAALRRIVTRERDLARETLEIMLRRPTIGYEAANHYYFSRGSLAEKIVNCEYLLEKLG